MPPDALSVRARALLLLAPALLLLGPTLLLSGCVSTKIESNRDASYTGSVERLFVFVSTGAREQNVAQLFATAIEQELAPYDIPTKARVRDPLALEGEELITEEVEAFGPSALLVLTQTEAGTFINGGGGGTNSAVFDASLIDVESERRVWRASIKASRDRIYATERQSANNLAEKIVEKLVEDGLLG